MADFIKAYTYSFKTIYTHKVHSYVKAKL
jgi:hypothetical protein